MIEIHWSFCDVGLSTRGTGDKYSNIGGLLYGHNETHVQLWSACNTDGTMPGAVTSLLLLPIMKMKSVEI